MEFYDAMKKRRSRYELTNTSPISNAYIKEMLENLITYTPSAFHSQSSRVVLLLEEEHEKLWGIVEDTLRAIVPADKFEPTEQKIASFAAGYGTILFFEDMDTVISLQEGFPSYADNFPVWSYQSSGMLQHAIWVALAQEGLGASLQHYNPIIDAEVAKVFDLPTNWNLLAQMPFGVAEGEPAPLIYKAIEERLIVKGNKHA